jgi:hypothetical protein
MDTRVGKYGELHTVTHNRVGRLIRFVHARRRDAGTLGVAAPFRHRILQRHVHHSPGYLPNALLLAKLAQAAGSYCLVPHRGRRTLERYDARSVPALRGG